MAPLKCPYCPPHIAKGFLFAHLPAALSLRVLAKMLTWAMRPSGFPVLTQAFSPACPPDWALLSGGFLGLLPPRVSILSAQLPFRTVFIYAHTLVPQAPSQALIGPRWPAQCRPFWPPACCPLATPAFAPAPPGSSRAP